MDNSVQNLSGGELQRVAIVLCLGTPADIYLVRVTYISLRKQLVYIFIIDSLLIVIITQVMIIIIIMIISIIISIIIITLILLSLILFHSFYTTHRIVYTYCTQIDEPSAYLDSEQRIAASKVCLSFTCYPLK